MVKSSVSVVSTPVVFPCSYHVVAGVQLCDGHVLVCNEPSLTKQEFAEECSMQNILDRANRGGTYMVNSASPMFGDFLGLPDYQGSLDFIIRSREMFDQLDYRIKERFANDPGKLLAFLEDGSNRDEAVKLGLLNPPPDKVEAQAPVKAAEGVK